MRWYRGDWDAEDNNWVGWQGIPSGWKISCQWKNDLLKWSKEKKTNLFQDLLNLTSDQPPLWKGETTANENIPIRLSDHIIQAEIINQKGETWWLAMLKPQLGIHCVTAVVGLRESILYDYFEIRSSPRTRKCRSWERKSWLLRGEGSCQKEKCLLFCTQQKKRQGRGCLCYLFKFYMYSDERNWKTDWSKKFHKLSDLKLYRLYYRVGHRLSRIL